MDGRILTSGEKDWKEDMDKCNIWKHMDTWYKDGNIRLKLNTNSIWYPEQNANKNGFRLQINSK